MIDWIQNNWVTILLVLTTVVGAASMVVKVIAPLTKSKLDDKLLGIITKISNFLDKLALNPSKTAEKK